MDQPNAGGFFNHLPPDAAREFASHTMTIMTFSQRAKEAGTIGAMEAQMKPAGTGAPGAMESATYFKAQAASARRLAHLQAELASAFEGCARVLEDNFGTN